MSVWVTPGIPLTTTRAVPETASPAPIASRHDSRSPRYSGLSSMSETGSTTIKSAAFVAVDRAMPQWAKT